MRFLFVAPRFHTNQYPTSKGLIDHGHEVYYLVQWFGVTEDYSFINPTEMKISRLGKRIKDRIYAENDKPTAETIMLDHFIPQFRFVYKYIKNLKPDIVILRDRIPSTLIANFACKLLGIQTVVLYNQTGLCTDSKRKYSLKQKLVFKLMPKVRYTISYIADYYDLRDRFDDFYIKPHEYFIPYVCPLNPDAEGRGYFGENGELRILCVGKYRPYKNQKVLIEALALLKERGQLNNIKLTMVGQAKCKTEEDYYAGVRQLVADRGLSDVVTFSNAIPYSEMGNLYQRHDIMTLTSLEELASISVVESMANAVPPVSTHRNGSAFYIKPDETGEVFTSDDPESLADIINDLNTHREKVCSMGAAAYKYVKENCMFDNFFGDLNAMMEKEFNISLK